MSFDNSESAPRYLPRLDVDDPSQLPVITFDIDDASMQLIKEADVVQEGYLNAAELAEVGIKVFDVPFHTLEDTLKGISGRTVATKDIKSISGYPLAVAHDTYSIGYEVKLEGDQGDETLSFCLDLARIPVDQGFDMRPGLKAIQKVGALLKTRASYDAQNQFGVITPFTTSTTEHNGSYYSLKTRPLLNENGYNELLLNESVLIEGRLTHIFSIPTIGEDGELKFDYMQRIRLKSGKTRLSL
jgi:hypothetical protein